MKILSITSLLLLSSTAFVAQAKSQAPIDLPYTSLQKEVYSVVDTKVVQPLRDSDLSIKASRFSRVRMPSVQYDADVDRVAVNGRVAYQVYKSKFGKNRQLVATGYYTVASKHVANTPLAVAANAKLLAK